MLDKTPVTHASLAEQPTQKVTHVSLNAEQKFDVWDKMRTMLDQYGWHQNFIKDNPVLQHLGVLNNKTAAIYLTQYFKYKISHHNVDGIRRARKFTFRDKASPRAPRLGLPLPKASGREKFAALESRVLAIEEWATGRGFAA